MFLLKVHFARPCPEASNISWVPFLTKKKSVSEKLSALFLHLPPLFFQCVKLTCVKKNGADVCSAKPSRKAVGGRKERPNHQLLPDLIIGIRLLALTRTHLLEWQGGGAGSKEIPRHPGRIRRDGGQLEHTGTIYVVGQ